MFRTRQVALKGRLKNGFTLIELLVVIAIIGILAAILFPVFARARENARRSSCQSNLKQIGLGILQYCQDFDERFPLGWHGSYSTPNKLNVVDDIDPYVKSKQVWKCPSGPKSGNGSNRTTDYGYNYALLGCDFSNPAYQVQTTHQSEILSTSTQIMMADFMYAVYNAPAVTKVGAGYATVPKSQWYEYSADLVGAPGFLDMPGLWFPYEMRGPKNAWVYTGSWQGNKSLAPRHFDDANVLFIDGHVKFRSIADIYSHGPGDPACAWCNGL